eukprot:403363365
MYTPNNKTQIHYDNNQTLMPQMNLFGTESMTPSNTNQLNNFSVTQNPNQTNPTKRIVISRKNIQIEESRVFDNNEEICNNDQLKRIEKHQSKLQQLRRSKNQSVITVNFPTTSMNHENRNNHTRINSNLYGGGQSVLSNYNPNSPRNEGSTNNDFINHTVLPNSFINQPYHQVFHINDENKIHSPFEWVRPSLKEAELILQLENKKIDTSQDLTTQQNYNSNQKLLTDKGLKNKGTASTANNTVMNLNNKTYNSHVNTMTSANNNNKILHRDINGIRHINFQHFMPQFTYNSKNGGKALNFEIQNNQNANTKNEMISQNTQNNNINIQEQIMRDLSQSNFSQIHNEVQFSQEEQEIYENRGDSQRDIKYQNRVKQQSVNIPLQSIDSRDEHDGYFESDSKPYDQIEQNQIIDMFTNNDDQYSEHRLNFLRSSNILENNRVFDNLNTQHALLTLAQQNNQVSQFQQYQDAQISNQLEFLSREENNQSLLSNHSLKLTLNLNQNNLGADYGDQITRNNQHFSLGGSKAKKGSNTSHSRHPQLSQSSKKRKRQSFLQTMKSIDSSLSQFSGIKSKKSKKIFVNDNNNDLDIDLNESQTSIEMRNRRKETLEDILMIGRNGDDTYSNHRSINNRSNLSRNQLKNESILHQSLQSNPKNSTKKFSNNLLMQSYHKQQQQFQLQRSIADNSVEEYENNLRFQFEKSMERQRDSTITIKFKDPNMSSLSIKHESLNQSQLSKYKKQEYLVIQDQFQQSQVNSNRQGQILLSGAITKKGKVRKLEKDGDNKDMMLIKLQDFDMRDDD